MTRPFGVKTLDLSAALKTLGLSGASTAHAWEARSKNKWILLQKAVKATVNPPRAPERSSLPQVTLESSTDIAPTFNSCCRSSTVICDPCLRHAISAEAHHTSAGTCECHPHRARCMLVHVPYDCAHPETPSSMSHPVTPRSIISSTSNNPAPPSHQQRAGSRHDRRAAMDRCVFHADSKLDEANHTSSLRPESHPTSRSQQIICRVRRWRALMIASDVRLSEVRHIPGRPGETCNRRVRRCGRGQTRCPCTPARRLASCARARERMK